MSIVILGIDLGKNSCSVVGLDETGRLPSDGGCVVTGSSPLPPGWLPA